MPDVARLQRPWAMVALGVVMLLVGIAAALARKALVPLLVLTVIPLLATLGPRQFLSTFRLSPLLLGAGVFVAWAVLSNAWGYDLNLLTLARVVLTIALAMLAVAGVKALSDAARLDRWIIAGGWLVAAFLVTEAITGAWISGLLHPDLTQSPLHYARRFDYAGGGAAVVAPTCFAIAVLIYTYSRSVIATLGYFALAFVGCLLMPMAAATLAIVLGSIAFAAAYFFRRVTLALIFGGFAMYLVTSPLIVLSDWSQRFAPEAPPAASAFESQDVVTRQARLGIWHHVARLAAEKPIVGHGFGAARDLSARNERLPNIDLAAIPIHPHNGALQIWLELGAVGVVIVGGILFAAWRMTRGLWHRPLAAATVAGTLTAAAVPILVSFSLWNTWWLAALGFAAVFTVRAVTAAPDTLSGAS